MCFTIRIFYFINTMNPFDSVFVCMSTCMSTCGRECIFSMPGESNFKVNVTRLVKVIQKSNEWSLKRKTFSIIDHLVAAGQFFDPLRLAYVIDAIIWVRFWFPKRFLLNIFTVMRRNGRILLPNKRNILKYE